MNVRLHAHCNLVFQLLFDAINLFVHVILLILTIGDLTFFSLAQCHSCSMRGIVEA